MKKKFLTLFALFALFSLAVAAYAYTNNTGVSTSSSCCTGKDSCPMKGKSEHGGGGDHAKMSCCKKHDGGHAKKAEDAPCDCCGDSCPMKKGDGVAKTEDGKNCCDDCECCKDKAKSETAAV